MNNNTYIKFKYILGTVLLLLPFLLFPGCQKVINVDLNESAPRIVIEGLISDRREPYVVAITRSASYFNQPVIPRVSGAIVVISDNINRPDTLNEESPGAYFSSRIRGIPGRTYTLKVIADGQEYSATSIMASHVTIDSLTLVKSDFQHFGLPGDNKNHYEIHCFFFDPPLKNYYRIKVFRNDSISTLDYRLFDDQYTNGELTEIRVSNALAGQTYRIELMSIDKQTYSYYRGLDDILFSNPFFGSTPANPNSNLSNGALGYFGTAAISIRTIVVPVTLSK